MPGMTGSCSPDLALNILTSSFKTALSRLHRRTVLTADPAKGCYGMTRMATTSSTLLNGLMATGHNLGC